MICLRHFERELQLRHTFRLARGPSDSRKNLFIELEHGGLVGLGEAAPIERYAQDVASAAKAVETMIRDLGDPLAFNGAATRVAVAGQPAAEAAIDMALYDLAGKRLGVPVYELLGIDADKTPVTSFTIGMDTPEIIEAKVEEAADYAALKVKMGSDDDRQVLETVRRFTDRPLRVDANEGWSFEGAVSRLAWLQEMGVELVEQPLPEGELEAMQELRELSPLPLFADESCHRAADIPRLTTAFDGVNIKLMKCGGLSEALRMIAVARAHGMQIMLGCMVESSLAITAAAHLSPLVDYADLDGNLLISNDPFTGAKVEGGRLVLPGAPGLGVRRLNSR